MSEALYDVLFSHRRALRLDEMPFSSVNELQQAATLLLREAIQHERCRRPEKAVRGYRNLLRLIGPDNFPSDVEFPRGHAMLLYEVHYHIGLALLTVGEYKKAAEQFTKAVNSVFIAKNGCSAGCGTNSCLQLPLYARRALAYGACGDLLNCMKDAEKCVVLDRRNADTLCVRALARNTRGETDEAIADLKSVLSDNPDQLSALILLGATEAPKLVMDWAAGIEVYGTNIPHEKACQMNPEVKEYLTVKTFQSRKILSFFDKFLISLNVPHTISTVNLDGLRIREKHDSRIDTVTDASAPRLRFLQPEPLAKCEQRAFRCGTTEGDGSTARQRLRRRKQYGQSLWNYVQRPKSAADIMASLEARIVESQKEALRRPCTRSTRASTPATMPSRGTSAASGPSSRSRTPASTGLSPASTRPVSATSTVLSKGTVPVFQPVNIKEAPRMYYRPWTGDKLPVKSRPPRASSRAFYV